MKRIFFLLLLLSNSFFTKAEADIKHVDIIETFDNVAVVDIAENIRRILQQAQFGIDISIHKRINYQNNNPSTTLVITIGDESLTWLNSRKNSFAGSIVFYINSTLYYQQYKSEQHISAIFRDQPLIRQLRLTKLLLPNLQRVTILHGPDNQTPSIETLEHESQLNIDEVIADHYSKWPKLLSQSLQESDVLLGIDDPNIYNGDTIRSILLTAYRHNKGLIGPSRAFVNAGGLASCYTSPDQFLKQLVEMVSATLRNHKLPAPQFPSAFHIAINKQVAASLDIDISDENTLSARLRNQSGECSDGC